MTTEDRRRWIEREMTAGRVFELFESALTPDEAREWATKALSLVIAAEREACARLADLVEGQAGTFGWDVATAGHIANLIRERGNQ